MATKSVKKIQQLLEAALLNEEAMSERLFAFEFEAEDIAELRDSLVADNDDYLFAVTENTGEVAMILLEKTGEVHRNETARARLQEYWQANYRTNLALLIPQFALQLAEDELPINGVKVKR